MFLLYKKEQSSSLYLDEVADFVAILKVDLFCDFLVCSLEKMHFILRRQSRISDHRTGVFMFVFILVGVFNEKEAVASQ